MHRDSISSWMTLIAAIALVGVVNCAYFNTYYNASVAYDGARKLHQKIDTTGVDSSSGLSPRMIAGYDTAISKSLKVLQNFQRSEKWHDDAVFLIARSLFYKGEYQRAQRRLRQILEEYPTSPFVPQAYLYLGKAYLYDGNLIKADEILSFILVKYPQLNQNQEVSMLLAELAIQREGKALAIELLEKARASVKDESKRMELHLQIAKLYVELRRYEPAQKLLETAPRKRNRPEILYGIDHLLVVCAMEQSTFDIALKRILSMARNKLYYRHMAEILLTKATILDKTGKVEEAMEAYNLVVMRHPTTGEAGLAWFHLAVINQKNKGDYEKAEECYGKAIDLLKDPDLKQVAIERRDALALIRTARNPGADSAASGTIDSVAFDKYRLGEIFWLRLDEPDSALARFWEVVRDTSTDSIQAAKSLYAIGWILLAAKKDTAGADSVLTVVEQKYAHTIFAPKSQELRGKKVTIFTRPDSAQQAYLRAEERLFDADDPSTAVEEFLLVYRRYSDLEPGRKALYAAAWLNDFVLERNKTAYALYKEVCDSFPESELCKNAAEPRLRVVKDSLRVRKANQPLSGSSSDRAPQRETKRPSGKRMAEVPPASADTSTVVTEDHDGLVEVPPPVPVLPPQSPAPVLPDSGPGPSPAPVPGAVSDTIATP